MAFAAALRERGPCAVATEPYPVPLHARLLKTTGSLSSSAAFLLLLANAAAPSLLPAAASSFASRYGLIALCAAMGLQALAALCGGTTGAFEVLEERPGKPARVLHSKLATGEMPEVDAVLAMLKD